MNYPLTPLRPVDRSSRRIAVTPAARSAIAELSQTCGQQALLLAWPAGAACVPTDCYRPYEYDVIVGHVEGCPIFADIRRLGLYADRRVVLDIDPQAPRWPLQIRVKLAWQRTGRLAPAPPKAARHATAPEGSDRALVAELLVEFAPEFGEAEIAAQVQRAVSDLRGSVSPDAMPEMATRLARHRISAIARSAPAMRRGVTRLVREGVRAQP